MSDENKVESVSFDAKKEEILATPVVVDNGIPVIDIEETPGLNTEELDIPIPESFEAKEKVTTETVKEVIPVIKNAEMAFDTFSPLVKKFDPTEEHISLPSATLDAIETIAENTPNIDTNDNVNGRKWAEALENSTEITTVRGIFNKLTNSEKVAFKQYIEGNNGGKLAAGIPNFKFNDGEKVSGTRAVMRFRSLLGYGTVLQIPMWHSGFWLTLKAPSEIEQLEIQRKLLEEKISLGRMSHGLVYANNSAYLAKWLIDFAIEHIYDTSIKGQEFNYHKNILITDLQTLIWGIACTIWPNGFQYTRACISDPAKCNHVVEEKLNLGKLLWVDSKALTEEQRFHMSQRGGSKMSMESIEKYQSQFSFINDATRTYTTKTGNEISITFKIPTLEEYINSGYRWVNGIVQMIDMAFTEAPADAKREYYINELGRATTMRQYAHWVKSAEGGGTICEDTETIERLLDDLSSDDDIRKKFFDDVIDYISDTTIGVIGVPTYTCPKCNAVQKNEDSDRFTHILPIDTLSTFFTLLVQKLQKIRTRQ